VITTMLESSGANAGQKNFCWAWSTPVRTTPMPYSTICGANTTRKYWPAATCAACAEASRPGLVGRASTIGPASSATATEIGTRTASAHVSMAEEIRSTSLRRWAANGPARRGTTAPASAPPAATS